MFETTSQFLWFFIPMLSLIVLGFIIEDKLAKIERGVVAGVRQTVKEWRDGHDKV